MCCRRGLPEPLGLGGSLLQYHTRVCTLVGRVHLPGGCKGWTELEPLTATGLFSPRSFPTRTWTC